MPSRLILRLLVVFTRQLEILVTTLSNFTIHKMAQSFAFDGTEAIATIISTQGTFFLFIKVTSGTVR